MTRGQWIALDVLAVALMVLVGHGQTRDTATYTAGAPFPAGVVVAGVLVVLAALPVVLRRLWPVPVLAWTLLMAAVLALVRFPGGEPFLPTAFALYTVAATRPRRTALLALAGTEAVMVGLTLAYLPVGPNRVLANGIGTVLVQGAAWAIGYSVHQARAYGAGLT